MTDVYMISGFLGAGKTTWIQKMLAEAFQGQKVVLIENDFGKESVDAALLRHQGVTVTEINSGCICCSLAGDFVKAIGDILRTYEPQVLLIEPSGVGKLSDVEKACSDPSVRELLHLAGKMTVADVTRFALYMENFGAFFEDQIRNADVVLFSHLADHKKVQRAKQAVLTLNPQAEVFDADWAMLSAQDVLCHLQESPYAKKQCACGHCHQDQVHHEQDHHDHEHHDHDHHDHEHHSHDADEVFSSVSIAVSRTFTRAELIGIFQRMEKTKSSIVRVKGILQGETANLNVQYVTGEVAIQETSAPAGLISFIGQDLDDNEISRLFD